MFSTNCKTVWHGTHILNRVFGCDATICFSGRSSEFGQEIFILGSFYTSTTNIKEFNMVDWPESETARKEDENPKSDHRTILQYIAYIKKIVKRKDSTITNNILEELNE